MRVQLDAVAAQTGMTGTFRLRSVDVGSAQLSHQIQGPRHAELLEQRKRLLRLAESA